jgi:hypothetical protein
MLSILISAQLSLLILLCVGSLVYRVGAPRNGSNDYCGDIGAAMQRYVAKRQRAEQRHHQLTLPYHYHCEASSDGRYNTTIVHQTDLF